MNLTMFIDFGQMGEKEVEFEVDYSPVIQAKISGPPEDCYPSEGGELYINKATCEGVDVTRVFGWDSLSDELAEKAEEAIQDAREDAMCARYEEREWA